MTLRTLGDVRELMRHLPADRRELPTWQHVAAELDKAAAGALCGGRYLKGTGSDRCRLSCSKLFECTTCRQLVSESALIAASDKRLQRKNPGERRAPREAAQCLPRKAEKTRRQ
jgi:hypothetical protein